MPPERHVPSNGPVRNWPIKVRQRNQKACEPCRRRKVKCDGETPCATCVGYGYDCIFSDTPARLTRPVPAPAQSQSNDAAAPEQPLAHHVASRWTPRLHNPCMIQESLVPPDQMGNHMLQNVKTRITSTCSAIAWPRRLGTSLDLPNPPRLQAFGWNPGTRTEIPPPSLPSITTLISAADMQAYADIYFIEIQPFFGILSPATFMSRSRNFYESDNRGADFEAVMCGVVALGSYFAGSDLTVGLKKRSPCEKEREVVEQARLLLELSTAYPPAMISCMHVIGWVLRAIYLRLTTRPHISWMASCTAVHLAEAVGLHREVGDGTRVKEASSEELEFRRRLFWVTISLNEFFAAEYGRSKVSLDFVNCHPVSKGSNPDDMTFELITLFQSSQLNTPSSTISESEIFSALSAVGSIPTKSPFLALIKADVSFSLYRKLCFTSSRLPKPLIPSLIEVIRTALDADKFLKSMNQPWWNVISTPFHAVCVLLSIGTSESLALIAKSLEVLKGVAAQWDSHISREAVRTAGILVDGARAKKRKELENLELGMRVENESLRFDVAMGDYTGIAELDEFQWQMEEFDMQFPDFLDLATYHSTD